MESSQAMFEESETVPTFGDEIGTMTWPFPLASDILGVGIGDCSCLVRGAANQLEAVQGTAAILDYILSEINRMRDWVQERCREGHLSEEMKRRLGRNMNLLKRRANEGRDWSDELVGGIEGTRRGYLECRDRRSTGQ